MSLAWWRKLASERMAVGASRRTRSALRVESLEDRTTPTALIAVGSQPGASPLVAVFDATSRSQLYTFIPYDTSVTGGVNVAVGDVNGDGTADVITGPGAGGGPVVKVFDGINGAEIKAFTVGDESSRAGVTVAAADIDNDGLADIVVGGIRNGQPLVQVLKFSDGSAIRGYTPFTGVGGVSVAAGDTNGDGTPDVIVGAGAGGAPRVTVFSGTDDAPILNFLAFEATFTGGVAVSAGDLNGDGKIDVVVAAGNLGGPRVQAFSGANGTPISNFFAYDSALRAGVQAVVADSNNDSTLDIVTSNGQGGADYKAFNHRTLAALAAPGFNGLPATTAYDFTPPTATVTTTAAQVSKTNPMPFTVTFNEAVNGFAAGDVTAKNGTVGNFVKVSATKFTFDVVPGASGDVVVGVAEKTVTDAAGNTNAASAAVTRTYDTTLATITAEDKLSNTGVPVLRGTINEPNSTVKVDVNGQTANATISGTTWTAAVQFNIPDGVYTYTATATDQSGNTSTATAKLTVDTTRPTGTASSTAPDPTNNGTVPFKITFNEDVTDFTQTDLVVSTGVLSAFTKVDARNYTFNVTVTDNSVVTVSVPAGAAQDAAGNLTQAVAAFSRTFNGGVTTPTFETVAKNPTNLASYDVVVKFPVGVTGFEVGDLVPTNANISNFSKFDAKSYSFTLAPVADGTVTVAIAAGAATDPANAATGAATYTTVSDRTAPTAVVTGASPTNTPVNFRITFNEDVTQLTAAGLTATNATVTTVSRVDQKTFDVTVTPTITAAGTITLRTNVGAVNDLAGNATTATFEHSVQFDPALSPTPVITGLEAASDSGTAGDGITNDATPTITGTTVTGATVEIFTDTGSGPVSAGNATVTGTDWSFTFAALADGTYTVTARATVGGGTPSAASAPFTLVIDTAAPAAPVVTGIDAASDSGPDGDGFTNVLRPVITGTAEAGALVEIFADDSTGNVSLGTVTATGGVWSFTPTADLVDGKTYAITATAKDAAANLGPASASFSLNIDATPPLAPVVVELDPTTDTGTQGDGITSNKLPKFNGTSGAGTTVEIFANNGTTTVSLGTATVTAGDWSFTQTTDLAEGAYRITAVATDIAGNVGPASAEFSLSIDVTAPAAPGVIKLSPASDTGTAADGVTSVDPPTFEGSADPGTTVEVFAGATSLGIATVAQDGTWTLTPGAALGEGTYTVTAVATDAAGNVSAASPDFTLVIDATAPAAGTVELDPASDTGTVTNDGITDDTTPTFFGTAEDGATVEVFVTVGTTTTSLGTAVATGGNWTFTPTTPLADGTYIVTVVVTDAAGNASASSLPLTLEIVPAGTAP